MWWIGFCLCNSFDFNYSKNLLAFELNIFSHEIWEKVRHDKNVQPSNYHCMMYLVSILTIIFRLSSSKYINQRKYFQQNYGNYYKLSNKKLDAVTGLYTLIAENEQDCIKSCNYNVSYCNGINVKKESGSKILCNFFQDVNGQKIDAPGEVYIMRKIPVTTVFRVFVYIQF